VSRPYLDTGAFAKWYVRERTSDDFAAFMAEQEGGIISRLGLVEFRCALARRRRAGTISPVLESESFRIFQDDVVAGVYEVLPLLDEHAEQARALIERLAGQPLRTLDALHLAAASTAGVATLATADAVMAAAARDLGLAVVTF
jgi:predicted nucleic acid-binding protein